MSRSARAQRRQARFETATPEQVSAMLRERIYGSIACLGTLVVLTRHVDDAGSGPWAAVADVLIATGGLWAASLFADYTAHLASQGHGPRGRERLHVLRSSGQILEASFLPLLLLVASGVGLLRFHTALWTAVWLLVGTLGVFALLAVRRTTLPWWQRIALAAALTALGVVIVLLKAAH